MPGLLEGAGDLQLIVDFMRMAAIVGGFCLVALGLYGLRKHSMPGSGHTIAQSIATMFAGAALVSVDYIAKMTQLTFLPEGMRSGVNPDPFNAYAAKGIAACNFQEQLTAARDSGALQGFTRFIPQHSGDVLWTLIYILGIYAYIKGIFLLRHVGSQRGSQEGMVASAFTHILGGFCLINITPIGCMLASAVGFSVAC